LRSSVVIPPYRWKELSRILLWDKRNGFVNKLAADSRPAHFGVWPKPLAMSAWLFKHYAIIVGLFRCFHLEDFHVLKFICSYGEHIAVDDNEVGEFPGFEGSLAVLFEARVGTVTRIQCERLFDRNTFLWG
jgi:hypothetical protein